MLVRLLLAIEESGLEQQLRRQLARADVIVDVLADKAQLWERVTRQSTDLLVASEACLPSPTSALLGELMRLPEAPGIVLLGHAISAEARAQWIVAGCENVLESTLDADLLVEALEAIIALRRTLVEQRLLTRRLRPQARLSDFASRSTAMQTFMATVQRVVNAEVSLLLLGETGVGKERLARAIHYESSRAAGPFVAVNCGALPESLLESELFGHERGAFTGATQARRGCFELAHGGTLFLDEIGEVPHHLQVKLLRVLQDREVRRLGGERATKVDVRIMAATNRDLEQEVEQRRFRQDLYYRLSVMVLGIPPLRERREDIPELLEGYIEYLRPQLASQVSGLAPDAREALISYAWPGNVRELVNVVERAMILCPGEEISLRELPVAIGRNPILASVSDRPLGWFDQAQLAPEQWLESPWREVRQVVLERAERAYLMAMLSATGGRIGETARRAGMQERSLFEKMRYYGLRKEQFRKASSNGQ